MDENNPSSAQPRSTNDGTSSNVVIAKCIRNRDTRVTSAEQSSDNQGSTEESDSEERLLTVCSRAGKLGAASYSLQTGELQILEEIEDRPPEHQIFVSLFSQVEPARVILDGKSQSTFVSVVKRLVCSEDTNEDARCKLTFISAKEFNFEACKRRIHSLSLPHEPKNCSDEERILFLRTVIDFAQTQTVHALGAMLRYLDLNWSKLCMDLHGKPQFLTLTRISLADIVAIDEDTYRGLQIFSSLAHPSGFKKGVQGSNKEGLSLYQLFSRCSSKVGHRKMRYFTKPVSELDNFRLNTYIAFARTLFRHPTTDLETLLRRQDVVAYFMRPQSDSLLRNICSSLRFIKNVNGILAKVKALSAKAYQWKSLYNTLYNVVLITEMCENVAPNVEYLNQLANFDTKNLFEMALYMNRIIDFDLSKSEGKFTVKAGVDPNLDLKKQTMASLHGLMSETAKVELERLPAFIEECAMLYIPHLGYLLGVKAWDDHLTMEQKELPDMKFMFQNNDYIHYKSKGCEELDVMIGDTYPEILAHETVIMMRLTAIILENLHTLAAGIDKCAELDCLITISKVCKEYSFVRPTLTTDKVIDIRQGRHPLYLATCDSFVPNDARSGGGEACVTVLTGPNASGKSVYIKQIGLIVYLAHIGSFVPAEAATIGVVAHIYSRIQATESVAAHMSAFLIDLRQMSLAVRESGSNSLLLVDEFGKGTAQTDGLALLAACLNTLLFREERCPHLLVCTHFLHLRQYLVDTPVVRFMRFEHMMVDGEPVFLFRAAPGSADCSLALGVAAANGIDAPVVHRARRILLAMENNTLPPPDNKIVAKLKNVTEKMKRTLLAEDI